MFPFFPTASQIQQFGAKNVRAVHAEVTHIQKAILAVWDETNQMEVFIADSPFATENIPGGDCSAQRYYMVWKNQTTDRAIDLQMQSVINYFTGLGYSIVRKANPNLTNTIAWEVKW